MPLYKCSLGFEQARVGSVPAGGFTDNWYADTDDIDALKTKCRDYLERRVAISNSAVTGVRLRISDTNAGTLTFQQQYRPGPGPFATPDTPWNSIWCAVNVPSLGTRREWLVRGMTDEFIVNGAWVPGAGWNANFAALNNLIKAAPAFSLRVISRSNAIKIVTSAAAGLVTLDSNAGIARGNLVRFFRTKYTDKNLGSVLGDWKVTDTVGGTQIQLAGWPDGGIVDHGKLRRIDYVAAAVVDIQVVGVRSRKLGRPLELLVGRAKRR